MAFEYQGFATLGVNLNRQKYGPLDISNVFTSEADLKYYLTKGTFTEGVSEYWTKVVPYPYEGQVLATVINGDVKVYVLKLDAEGAFEAKVIEPEVDGKTIRYTDGKLELVGLPTEVEGKTFVPTLVDGILTWSEPDTSVTDGHQQAIEGLTTRMEAAESAISGEVSAREQGDQEILDLIGEVAEDKTVVAMISEAEQAAKDYADGLASNYDSVGSAEQALEDAKAYADSLATNYDTVGSAEQALEDAKNYADSLADNYDAKGSADQALVDAKAYTDEVKATILGDNSKLVDTYDTLEEIGNWISTHEGETVVNLTQAISDEEQARKDADDAIIERVVELEKVDHEHSNKDVLDGMTASFTSELLEKLNGIEEGANKYELPSDVVQDSKYSERMAAVETAVSTVDSRIEDAVEGVKDEVAEGYLPVGGFVNKEYSQLKLSASYYDPDAPAEVQEYLSDEGYINLHAAKVSMTTPYDQWAKIQLDCDGKSAPVAEITAYKIDINASNTLELNGGDYLQFISESKPTWKDSYNGEEYELVTADQLEGKVDVEGYVAYSEEEKEKLAGLENYNDSELSGRVGVVEGYFTDGVANDAAKFGGQLPEYYATKASVEEAISGVHGHENKDVLDGISSADIEAWNNAEQNAKSYSDGKLDEAVQSLEGKISSEQSRAEGIEAGFESRIKALEEKEPTKVEVSETNGNIKVDGEEVKVYDDSSLVSRLEVVEGKPFDTYAIKSEVETALEGKVNNETLNSYYTKSETEDRISARLSDISTSVGESAAGVLAKLNAHKTEADGKFTSIDSKDAEQDIAIKANTDAIAILNGEGEGSVSKQVSDAIAEIVAEAPEAFDTLKEIADYIAGDKTNAAELLNKVNANSEAIAAEVKRAGDKESELAGLISELETTLEAAYKDADEVLAAEDLRLAGLIQDNTNLIATLNGEGEGSVNKKISDAVAAIPAIPAATASTLGLVKVGETISVDEEGTINVSKVSTDMLVQGEQELVLNGGSAK